MKITVREANPANYRCGSASHKTEAEAAACKGCEWKAYERKFRRDKSAPTQTLIRRRPPYGFGWDVRPATAKEAAQAEAEEGAERERIERHQAFIARPEWKIADSIRAAIENMTAENHPLDRLRPKQWAELYSAITGREWGSTGEECPA